MGCRARATPASAAAADRSAARSARRMASPPARPGNASRTADLGEYQRAKTGALFAAATVAGAAAAGADPEPWRTLGERLGEAYQVADDIGDVLSDPATLGKPTGQDKALGRPNAALTMGVAEAMRHLEALANAAAEFGSALSRPEGVASFDAERGAPAAAAGPGAERRVMTAWVSRELPAGRVSAIAASGVVLAGFRGSLARASRDRLLANASFQRWAAGFPFTRRIARDAGAGVVRSVRRVRLQPGPVCLRAPAASATSCWSGRARRNSSPVCLRCRSTRRSGCWKRPRRFAWWSAGVTGASASALWARRWPAIPVSPRWSAITRCSTTICAIRLGCCAVEYERRDRTWAVTGRTPERARPADAEAADVAEFSALMAASQALVAADVLSAYRFDRHRCLLDLGGGDGAFLVQAAAAAPALRLMLFDLPAVAARAERPFRRGGTERAGAGDRRRLPAGYVAARGRYRLVDPGHPRSR